MHKINLTKPLESSLVNKLHLSGIIAAAILLTVWLVLHGNKIIVALWNQLEDLWLNLFSILVTVLVHELCHFLVYPRDGKRRLGFTKKYFAPYAQYEGPLRKNRYLLACLAPFLILTIGPLLISILLNFSVWPFLVSIINVTLSTADIYVAYNIWKKAPPGSTVDYDETGFFAEIVN